MHVIVYAYTLSLTFIPAHMHTLDYIALLDFPRQHLCCIGAQVTAKTRTGWSRCNGAQGRAFARAERGCWFGTQGKYVKLWKRGIDDVLRVGWCDEGVKQLFTLPLSFCFAVARPLDSRMIDSCRTRALSPISLTRCGSCVVCKNTSFIFFAYLFPYPRGCRRCPSYPSQSQTSSRCRVGW